MAQQKIRPDNAKQPRRLGTSEHHLLFALACHFPPFPPHQILSSAIDSYLLLLRSFLCVFPSPSLSGQVPPHTTLLTASASHNKRLADRYGPSLYHPNQDTCVRACVGVSACVSEPLSCHRKPPMLSETSHSVFRLHLTNKTSPALRPNFRTS